jgi:predicted transcriptional regulator
MKKDTSVNVRLTSAERAELQRLADAAKRKLSDYIRLILQEHLENEKSAAAKVDKRKR